MVWQGWHLGVLVAVSVQVCRSGQGLLFWVRVECLERDLGKLLVGVVCWPGGWTDEGVAYCAGICNHHIGLCMIVVLHGATCVTLYSRLFADIVEC